MATDKYRLWLWRYLVGCTIVLGLTSIYGGIYAMYHGNLLHSLVMWCMACFAVQAFDLYFKIFKEIRFEIWLRFWRFRSERALNWHYVRFNKHKRAMKVTIDQWERLCADYGFMCIACGKTEPKIKLSIDHIVPLSKGGWHRLNNLQPLCTRCNSNKSTGTYDYRKDWTV